MGLDILERTLSSLVPIYGIRYTIELLTLEFPYMGLDILERTLNS